MKVQINVNNATEVVSSHQVQSGAGAKGQALRLQAQKDVKYELVNEDSGFAPENIATKRVGNDLHIAFEKSDIGTPDVIIEGYYDNPGTAAIVGKAESGVYYNYVPESGLNQEAISQLGDSMVAGQALGGEQFIAPFWIPPGVGPVAALGLLPLLAAGGGGGGGDDDGRPVNHAPTASDTQVATDEDTPINGLLPTASDADGDAITYAKGSDPEHGTVVVNSDGSYTYTPAADYNGSDSFTYTVSDGKGGSNTYTVTVGVTPVNDAPVAADDGPVIVTEGTPATGNVLANDSDVDGDDLVVTEFTWGGETADAGTPITVAGVGTLVIEPNGDFTFTPDPAYEGSAPAATYTVSDDELTDTATLGFAEGVNHAPTATADPVTTDEDTPATGQVVGVDADGDDLSYEVTKQPEHGEVTINPDGSYTYTPDADWNGADEFEVTVDDGQGGTTTVIVPVTVTPVNDAPVAVDDGPVIVTEATPATGNVLANDSDVDGDDLVVTEFTWGGETADAGTPITVAGVGTLVIDADGDFTFTPDPAYEGSAPAATYTVSDGELTDTATLGFAEGVNHAPTATADPVTTDEDTPVSGQVVGVDADGDDLSYEVTKQPEHGEVTINPDGSYTYTPDADWNGADEFEVTVDDGQGGTTTVIVPVTVTPVNDAPVAVDDSINTDHNTAVTDNVLTNDSDVETPHADLTVTQFVVDGDATVYAAGETATIEGVGTLVINTGGGYTFIPEADFEGAVPAVTYTVSDNDATDPQTATANLNITVGVNQAPQANPDTISPVEDTPIAVPLGGSDVDGTIVSVTITGGPSTGQGQLVYDHDGDPDTAPVAVPLDTALTPAQAATVMFVPAQDYNGPVDPVTFTVTDNGGLTSEPATVTINDVTPVNDAPVANAATISPVEDTPIAVPLTGSDVDGTIESVTITGGPSAGQGQLVYDDDGDPDTDPVAVPLDTPLTPAQAATVMFVPAQDYNGAVDPVTFTVTDNEGATSAPATVTIDNPSAVNDAPVAMDDSASTNFNTPVSGNVLANDTDVDTLPEQLTVTQFVVDGDATVYAAGDTATIEGVGTLVINTGGGYTFVPEADFEGAVPAVTYTVSDNDATDPQTATAALNITVSANQAPQANPDTISPVEDTPIAVPLGGSDVDGTIVSVTITGGPSASQGQLVYDHDGDPSTDPVAVPLDTALTPAQAATVMFVPAQDYNGAVDPVTFTVTDNDGATSAPATVTINNPSPVNDAPVADPATISPVEDTPIAVPLTGSDVDGTIVSVTITGGPSASQGQLVYDHDGDPSTDPVAVPLDTALTPAQAATVMFVPAQDYNGAVDPVTFTVTDNDGATSAPATVTINNPSPVNDAPVADDATISPVEDTPIAVPLGGSDVDGTIVSVTITGGPSAGQGQLLYDDDGDPSTDPVAVPLDTALTPAQAATVTFVPVQDYNGAVDPVTFIVTDNGGLTSAPATVTINDVTAVVDAQDDSASTGLQTPVTIDVLDNDGFAGSPTITHVDDQAITDGGAPVAVLNGSVTLVGGELVFTPADGFSGTAVFSYTAQTPGGAAETANVTVNVGGFVGPGSDGGDPNGNNTLTGGPGDDVLLGDVGGVTMSTEPGTNYNIVLLVDLSSSMNTGGRLQLMKDALAQFVPTLADHDGTINIAMIGFGSLTGTSVRVNLADLNAGNLDTLTDAINALSVPGTQYTNYEAGFNTAVNWFNGLGGSLANTSGDYENLTFFITDGDPTRYVNNNGTEGGTGNNATYATLLESVQAFNKAGGLSEISTVHAVGIGADVQENYLKFFDNTDAAGTGSVPFPGTTASTLATFNSSPSDPGILGTTGNWHDIGTGDSEGNATLDYTGNGPSRSLRIDDANNDSAGAAVVASDAFTVGVNGTTFSFNYTQSGRSAGDSFAWKLQTSSDGGATWTDVTGTSGSFSGNSTTQQTANIGAVNAGTYRFVFTVDDGSTGSNYRVAVDNLIMTSPNTVVGPVGDVDIVHNADDLTAVLQGGSNDVTLKPVGNDTVYGGDGSDIIFGDAINTDGTVLPWDTVAGGRPANLPDGSGLDALKAFLAARDGEAPDDAAIYNYIRANHADFNVENDPRGGNDELHGDGGDDILYGQGGDDTLYGGDGRDFLYGGMGDDFLYGEAGSDDLHGGLGNDTMSGGAGDDWFYFDGALNNGNDTIVDFSTDDNDKLAFLHINSSLVADKDAPGELVDILGISWDQGTNTMSFAANGSTLELTGVTIGSTTADLVAWMAANATTNVII